MSGGLVKDFTDIKSATDMVSSKFKMIIDEVGKMVQEFAAQERAVKSFNAAMATSPQISEAGAMALREYSRGIKAMTGETDQAVLGLETMLVKSGRSAQEVRKIITTSSDVSIASGKDLRSVVEQLNKTYGGLAGELAEVVPELRNLTKEQLSAGAGVDVLARKYAGLSEQLRETTDVSLKNYTNMVSELNAELGRSAERNLKPLRNWITSLGLAWAESARIMNNYYDEQERRKAGGESTLAGDEALARGRATEVENDMARRRTKAGFEESPVYRDLAKEAAALAKAILQFENISTNAATNTGAAGTAAKAADDETSKKQAELDKLVKENYTRLLDFLEGVNKQNREAEHFGEEEEKRYERMNRAFFDFSELTRGLVVDTKGDSLKKTIVSVINAALGSGAGGGGGVVSVDLVGKIAPLVAAAYQPAGPTDFSSGPTSLGNADLGIPRMGTGASDILAMISESIVSAVGNGGDRIAGIAGGAARGVAAFAANPNQVGGDVLSGLFGGLGGFVGRLMPMIGKLGSVMALLDPIGTILGGVMEVLGPVIDELLAPLVGILRILGVTLGKIIAPVLQALSPVIKAVSDGFIWLYNYVIKPIGNAIYASMMVLVNHILNFGILIANIANNLFNSKRWKAGTNETDWQTLYDTGPLSDISEDDLTGAGKTAITAAATGANASYQKPRDITVNIEITTAALVGGGGIRDFAIMIGRELRSAGVLGMA